MSSARARLRSCPGVSSCSNRARFAPRSSSRSAEFGGLAAADQRRGVGAVAALVEGADDLARRPRRPAARVRRATPADPTRRARAAAGRRAPPSRAASRDGCVLTMRTPRRSESFEDDPGEVGLGRVGRGRDPGDLPLGRETRSAAGGRTARWPGGSPRAAASSVVVAAQVREEFRVPDGAQRGERGVDPLVEEAAGPPRGSRPPSSRPGAGRSAGGFPRPAGRSRRSGPRAGGAPSRCRRWCSVSGQPESVEDLEGAVEAEAVVGVDAGGRRRVDAGEQRVQSAGERLPDRGDPAAQPRERRRRRAEPLEGRAQVQPGAADEERGAGAGGERRAAAPAPPSR